MFILRFVWTQTKILFTKQITFIANQQYFPIKELKYIPWEKMCILNERGTIWKIIINSILWNLNFEYCGLLRNFIEISLTCKKGIKMVFCLRALKSVSRHWYVCIIYVLFLNLEDWFFFSLDFSLCYYCRCWCLHIADMWCKRKKNIKRN